MAAITSKLPNAAPNRRRRVRHKIQTPAYASFTAELKGAMLDLHEIVDISEEGIAIQCHEPLEADKQLNLCLDLADCPDHIYTTGQVVWSNDSGRAGLRFSELSSDSLARLREWLFVNVMAGVANSEVDLSVLAVPRDHAAPQPNYSDTLAGVTAVRRQVEALGADLGGALQLIATRARSLVRASGAAIALADADPNFMVCRASSGDDAPPVGARLQVGSGFSGECVKRGVLLRCDDAELDTRVDRESCRALGIRSILAAPVRVGDKSVGLIEAFSAQPNAFLETDGEVFERLADLVLDAANRAASSENLPPLGPAPIPRFAASPGSVLFAAADDAEKKEQKSDEKDPPGISLPRSYLVILVCAAATITFILGWGLAPWIQSSALPWIQNTIQNKIHAREHTQLATVLASSQPPKSDTQKSDTTPANPHAPAFETATLEQLRQMAEKGDPAAENALGLRYAAGQDVKLNEGEAVRWFTKAAEQGYVPAQSKLGSLYYSGRGVPEDANRAYFWMVVARFSGDEASKTLAPFVRARLTRSQITSIELDADRWLQEHHTAPAPKPAAGQLRAKF
jgi:TPR repeat protein